ncbi:GGDEF domain-containing protein [Velocimicrobium porci]|uniref:Diguanylate cyclase n=1 Tax=Velocimicrobium porci TaxID=2606634 RepID=A0A6L5XZQ4_9FIRM|nr:diguanylate cyclase [Velocimicrobium porci]MSS64057.1 diguanylate cyclase [Velocimicrobium porci]
MKKSRYRIEGDFSFLAILLLILVCLVFTGNSAEQWAINIAMFCVASMAFLVTYFISITAGLIVDLLILFVYVSYILYGVIHTGDPIDMQLYFWMIWIPLTTIAFHFFTKNMNQLQEENRELKQRVEELALYDEATGLENLYSFENECVIYMRIAERYKMSLILLVWELRYENEISRLMGKQKFAEQIKDISGVAQKSLRKEDSLFLLRDTPYLWGTIMFTNPGGEAIVIDRLKKNLEEEQKNKSGDNIQIDMRFGTAVYENGNQSPLEFLEIAKKRLSYDVPSDTI